MKKLFFKFLMLNSFLLLASSLYSQGRPERPRGDGQKHRTPPFVSACDNLKEGVACSFSDRNDTKISGVCKKMPKPNQGRQASVNDDKKMETVCYNKTFFDKIKERRENRPRDGRGPRTFEENDN